MKISKEFALILSFTFLAFILGTTEYVIVGLLPDVAQSLNVAVSQAGILVSGFAVAYAVGTPFAMAAASYVSKRTAVLIGILLISLLNISSAFAPTYMLLFVSRLAAAVCCGLSVSLAISICTELVSARKKGQAVAYIMGGFTIANVLGVPIGTFVAVHFQWPAAFILVAVSGFACACLLYKMIPRGLPAAASSARDQLRLMINPRLILAFLIPICGVAAIFVVYTYITPIFTQVMNIPIEWTSSILLVYGAATVISNIIGGKIASGDLLLKLRRVFLIDAAIFILFGFTISHSLAGIATLMAIACISFSINAAAQLYFTELSVRFVPEAKDFASSLFPVGANIGIALGSAAGAFVTERLGLVFLPWIAVGFALVAYAITTVSWRLDRLGTKSAITHEA